MTALSPPLDDPWPAPHPVAHVERSIRLPGSKSLTNRALILAALADGPSRIKHPLRSRDTLLMAAALRSLGTDVSDAGPGTPPGEWAVAARAWHSDAQIDCGLAGTVMRFVPPVAGLARGRISFDGDPHMRRRPVGPMLGALTDLGLTIEDGGRRALPFTVDGAGSVRGGRVVIDASASSQFVSALLLAGATYERGVEVVHEGAPIPSQPHIDMTLTMLAERGVVVDADQADRWVVSPGPIRALDVTIEPDLSNAAPFVGLAAAVGGDVTVLDWPTTTTQPGDQLRTILTQMGCTVTRDERGVRVIGPDALEGIDLDMHEIGELTPAVAALCALAQTPSHLYGIEHIRGHETDRLAALSTELTGLGADVTEHRDGLTIRPAPLHGGVFHTYADHRMAHAGVILGAAVPGVLVEDVATTAKTFPQFAPTWAAFVSGR